MPADQSRLTPLSKMQREHPETPDGDGECLILSLLSGFDHRIGAVGTFSDNDDRAILIN